MTGVAIVSAVYGLVFLVVMGAGVARDRTDPPWVRWFVLAVLGAVAVLVVVGVVFVLTGEAS